MVTSYIYFYRECSECEDNIKIDGEEEHREYREKLHVNNEHLPDPVDLKTGWIREDKRMCQNFILVTFHSFIFNEIYINNISEN